MPEITVIVPVYNVEKYLGKCLDSILSQSFSNIEIICVNDGSTDNSRKILQDYKNKDSRIIILDKKNGGLSSARNAGLNIARGKYISFVDSDDWIENDMLELMYSSMENLNTDISICQVHQFDESKQKIDDSNPYYTLEYFNSSFDNRSFSYLETKSFIMDVCVMAWNKLYRRSFLDSLNARFPDGKIFEDGPFFFSIFFNTKKVNIVRKFLYNYRINRKGSIIEKGGRQFLDIIDVVELMFNEIKNSDCFDEIKNEFYCRKINDIVYRYDLVDIFCKKKFSKKLKEKTFLFDFNIFDYNYICENSPVTLRSLYEIKNKSNIFSYYLNKFKIKMMYKIMQILYTEENIYYFKYRKLIIRIKKRANLYDIWYENDRIYVILFNIIKFNFKFEYSKLERSNNENARNNSNSTGI